MNVLFLGYWGANDGLSQSTINPHLKILSSLRGISKVVYISVERNKESFFQVPDDQNILHLPFYSGFKFFRGINKLSDFVRLPHFVAKVIAHYQIDFLICRSSLAGAIGYVVHRKMGIPYAVESFEPHAMYMVEAGIWRKNGLSYRLQARWEEKQKKTAEMLMPVSNLYKQKLIEEGVPEEKLFTVPCAVNLEEFAFSVQSRRGIRSAYGIDESSLVGIYVGKFGGIYLDQEAFRLFACLFNEVHSFFLFILTPQNSSEIYEKAKHAGIEVSKVKVMQVSHAEVPKYLSAADVAFSFHSPTPSKQYVSPIKNGEYWANGLPIIMPEGIGDDSEIIKQEKKAGILWKDINRPDSVMLKQITENFSSTERDNSIAKKYRDFGLVRDAYFQIGDFFNTKT